MCSQGQCISHLPCVVALEWQRQGVKACSNAVCSMMSQPCLVPLCSSCCGVDDNRLRALNNNRVCSSLTHYSILCMCCTCTGVLLVHGWLATWIVGPGCYSLDMKDGCHVALCGTSVNL
jgi:hypothetical protein